MRRRQVYQYWKKREEEKAFFAVYLLLLNIFSTRLNEMEQPWSVVINLSWKDFEIE